MQANSVFSQLEIREDLGSYRLPSGECRLKLGVSDHEQAPWSQRTGGAARIIDFRFCLRASLRSMSCVPDRMSGHFVLRVQVQRQHAAGDQLRGISLPDARGVQEKP